MQSRLQDSSQHTLMQLPFEVASQILSPEHLDAQSLIRSSQVCKGWQQLCDNDEIWQRAAHAWGYVSKLTLTVEDVTRAKMDENGYYCQVKTWRDLCVAQELLDAEVGNERRGTELRYPLSYSFHAAQSEETPGIWQDVYRMIIIAEDGLIASTSMGGGVRVSDLHTHELLWSTPQNATSQMDPHLEADSGYLVWRSPPGELLLEIFN